MTNEELRQLKDEVLNMNTRNGRSLKFTFVKGGPKFTIAYKYNDGGRKDCGFKGYTGDCVTRAVAIANKMDYRKAYKLIDSFGQKEYRTKRRAKRGRSAARTGVYKQTSKKILKKLGWDWKPTMFIGSGCRVHLRSKELPMGTLIVSVSKHLTTVIDGVINDTHDCSREGTRCVYGYWYRKGDHNGGEKRSNG
tara:strand:+ start:856 stop:1434 length:579 start_codon:yes stop_codon:yes gene_type:complete